MASDVYDAIFEGEFCSSITALTYLSFTGPGRSNQHKSVSHDRGLKQLNTLMNEPIHILQSHLQTRLPQRRIQRPIINRFLLDIGEQVTDDTCYMFYKLVLSPSMLLVKEGLQVRFASINLQVSEQVVQGIYKVDSK